MKRQKPLQKRTLEIEKSTGLPLDLVLLTEDYLRQLVVVGLSSGLVEVWDIEKKKCVFDLKGHTDEVYSVAVTKDGRIVSGSWDGTVRVWNPETKECVCVLECGDRVLSVAVL